MQDAEAIALFGAAALRAGAPPAEGGLLVTAPVQHLAGLRLLGAAGPEPAMAAASAGETGSATALIVIAAALTLAARMSRPRRRGDAPV